HHTRRTPRDFAETDDQTWHLLESVSNEAQHGRRKRNLAFVELPTIGSSSPSVLNKPPLSCG
ncbi:hypothetical protein, partial [Klebsiella pneumoniae]|uniref:hypothetical protein n=1 Tax=Klebsiella pneumoniae TaxID=573 RepID=UPI0019533C92